MGNADLMSGTRQIKIEVLGDATGAKTALRDVDVEAATVGDHLEATGGHVGGFFDSLGQKLGNWGVPFAGSLSSVGAKFDETSTKGQKFGQAMSTIGGAALLGIAAGAAAAGVEAVKLGNTLEESQAQLSAAIKASGETMAPWQAQIE